MRSETKIGVGVGAVLLVIIVGYLAVHTSDKKGEQLDTSASSTPGSNSSSSPAPGSDQKAAAPDKTPVAQTNLAAENKPVDATPPVTSAPPAAGPTAPAGTSSVTISGPSTTTPPTTAPSAVAAAPTTPAPTPATETPGAAASARQGNNYDWNKLLNDGQSSPAGAGSDTGASTGTGSPTGTSTSNLYASSSTPDTGASIGSIGSTGSSARSSHFAGPTTAPSSAATGKHVVKSGETLSSIAAATYGSANYWPAIARANPGLNPNAMHAGQSINLPDVSAVKTAQSAPDRTPAPSGSTLVVDPTKEYAVQQGDSLYTISIKLYGTPSKAQAIYDLNKTTIGPSMSRLKVHQVLKLPAAPSSRPA
jgi:LysM repeat protein